MKIHKTRVNRRSLVRWKVYFDRSRMYIGYIQFFLIGIVFLKSFDQHPAGEFIFKYAFISVPIVLLLFIFLSLVLGYLDNRLGFREEELRNLTRSNPVMMEILHSIHELQEEIRELKQTKS
ncbi:hypothetical protein JW948_02730 [bacterium]|nr:hypothetical protein [bacterium]